MKVVLYMTITSNGFIGHEDGSVDYALKGAWKSYTNFFKKTKNIIIGRTTYENMKQSNDFAKINNPFTVVVTSKTTKNTSNIVFVNSPKAALDVLKKKNFKTALVAGGSKVNTSFLKENLIDEVILDVEPFLFGEGIKLFDIRSDVKLQLLSTKKISKDEIQLHYKIVKQ